MSHRGRQAVVATRWKDSPVLELIVDTREFLDDTESVELREVEGDYRGALPSFRPNKDLVFASSSINSKIRTSEDFPVA